jgi:hypothetical protein
MAENKKPMSFCFRFTLVLFFAWSLPALALMGETNSGGCLQWRGMHSLNGRQGNATGVEINVENTHGCESRRFEVKLTSLTFGRAAATLLPTAYSRPGIQRLRWMLVPGVYNVRVRDGQSILLNRTFQVARSGTITYGWNDPLGPKVEPAILWEKGISVWGAYTYEPLLDTPTNTGNFNQLPNQVATVELRPSLKASGKDWKATLRPRVIGTRKVIPSTGTLARTDLKAKVIVSEAFGTYDATETLSLSYGLQNFQWGPAESASPSNFIFHDNVQAKDSLFETRGKHLLRVNYTPLAHLSEVLLVEPSTNGEQEFEYNEKYSRKVLLKSEYSWAGGSSYAGLVLGWRENFGKSLGEYASTEVLAGLDVYLDANHHQGNLAYYPTSIPTGPTSQVTLLTQSRRENPQFSHFLAAGGRYSFGSGNEARLEGIYQSSGYSPEEFLSAWNALIPSSGRQLLLLPTNTQIANQNGLEFPGRRYAYLSFRFPDVLGVQELTIYLRSLWSLQDHSNASYLSAEKSIGEHGNVFGNINVNSGNPATELRGLMRYSGTIGYRQTW